MKKTNRSLTTSMISLLLCFAMLLGTTYAWFTDVAFSTGNIIQTGNLDLEMYWSNKRLEVDSDEWALVNDDPIFTYDNWEPGYTDVKYIKISNMGDLAFQWRLNIQAEGEMSKLADIIDVYYVNPANEDITSLDGRESVGVLSNVIENFAVMSGVLLPQGEVDNRYTTGDVVVAIDEKAFFGNESLKAIELPSTVSDIVSL